MVENNNCFVIDVSVVLAVLLPDEQNLTKIKRLARLIAEKSVVLYCPRLLRFEFGNGLRLSVLRKRLRPESVAVLLRQFEKMPLKFLSFNMTKVLDLAIENKLSFYDASYLCLALEKKAKLLTLDERLEKIWRKLKKI
ncbi:type II toxin-antitoxin system VapC family toxin [Patescibacteria group bacterium]|nr:type II toxin-antitoxin system VapC family toxin [Patescibacteria group bacterium]